MRIITYNIFYGGEERIPLIAQILRGQNPDFVALQEANDRSNAEKLAAALYCSLCTTMGSHAFSSLAGCICPCGQARGKTLTSIRHVVQQQFVDQDSQKSARSRSQESQSIRGG